MQYFVDNQVMRKSYITYTAKHINAKLELKYKGPYTIMDVIVPYVYKIGETERKQVFYILQN